MNPNIHGMPQPPQMSAVVPPGPNTMMQSGVSPVMLASPQAPNVMATQVPNPNQPQAAQQQQQQQPPVEKLDNISKIKSLLPLLRESLFLTQRSAAFVLQQNNLADNLKRDCSAHQARFEKNLEDFFCYCDLMELNLKTALQCMQQLQSVQHYLPGQVSAMRMEPYIQDMPTGPMPYTTYLNTTRVHIQSAKDIHDMLISAAQNISQPD